MSGVKRALVDGPSSFYCNERNWFFPIYKALSKMDPETYKGRYGDRKVFFKEETVLLKFLRLLEKYDKKDGRLNREVNLIVYAPKVIVDSDKAKSMSHQNLIYKTLPQVYKPRAKGKFYVQSKMRGFQLDELESIMKYCDEVGIHYNKNGIRDMIKRAQEHNRRYYYGSLWFSVDNLSDLSFLTLRNASLTHKTYINSAHGDKDETAEIS